MSSSTVVVIVRTAHEVKIRRIRAWLVSLSLVALFMVALLWEPLDFIWH